MNSASKARRPDYVAAQPIQSAHRHTTPRSLMVIVPHLSSSGIHISIHLCRLLPHTLTSPQSGLGGPLPIFALHPSNMLAELDSMFNALAAQVFED